MRKPITPSLVAVDLPNCQALTGGFRAFDASPSSPRVNDRPVTWHVKYAGARVGMIVERSGSASTRCLISAGSRRYSSQALWFCGGGLPALEIPRRGISRDNPGRLL